MAVCMSSRLAVVLLNSQHPCCFAPNAKQRKTHSWIPMAQKRGLPLSPGGKSPSSFRVGPSGQPHPPLHAYPTRPRCRYGGMEGGMLSCASQHIRRSVQYAMKSPEIRHAAYADGFFSRSHMIHMIHQLKLWSMSRAKAQHQGH